MTENEIATVVVDLCYNIHRQYGPGMFESAYDEIFCYEWSGYNIPFKRQYEVPIIHDNMKPGPCFRADLIVEDKVILEFKSIEAIGPLQHKQLLTYLKLTNLKLGLLINFNVPLIKDGIHRVVNKL